MGERGQLTPMLMLTMEAMEVMAAMVDTDTARGLLMLMPTMAMVATVVATEAMADMALAAMVATEDMVGMAAMVDMDTERGQLMPMPTMAMVDMADMAVDMADMATESKLSTILYLIKATNQTSQKFDLP